MALREDPVDSDQTSLDGIRRGGATRAEGIVRLYRAYARRFLGYFLKHRVPREQAEELVQDVFVSIVRHCGEFRGEARIDAWMWAIARNALIDHVRRQRPEVALQDDELLDAAGATVDPPSHDARDLEDCVRRAYAAFAAAHEDRAQVLALVVYEEWDISDVAAMVRRTPGATREYLSQCRKKLRPFLEPCRELLGLG